MTTLRAGCKVEGALLGTLSIGLLTLGAGWISGGEGTTNGTRVCSRGERRGCLARTIGVGSVGAIICGVVSPGASQRWQVLRKSLIALNCASKRAVGASTRASVSEWSPCSILSAGDTVGIFKCL